jgi:iron complex outermembrane receptor protein
MIKFRESALKGLACSVSAVALTVAAPALAQDSDDTCELNAAGQPDEDCGADGVPEGVTTDSPTTNDETPQDIGNVDSAGAKAGEGEAIVVTGSRVKQDTYNTISPLQVLSTEAEQDVGLFDPATILQRSESAAGQQIDASFQGFVLDNGPGSQTINLRGLGADRTLLLVNGRRLAPAGVEGAPSAPSINLLPGSLIARYELLLDGASSVYGSDAVAGVGNIILRKDFEGPELFVSGNLNPMGGGDDYTVSGAWGKTFDRGFIGIGAEYSFRDRVQLRDRDFLSGCETHYEITDTGEIRTIDLASNAAIQNRNPNISTTEEACKITTNSGRIFIEATNFGSVYFEPGRGNTPIPDFGETTIFGRDIDADGDGMRDVNLFRHIINGVEQDIDFISQQKLYNDMAYGEYSLGGGANLTPFFEANYSRAEIDVNNGGHPQLFPYVPADNATNPCNFIDNPNGVDCRAADNEMRRRVTGTPGRLSTGFQLPVEPIVAIRGDRNNVDVVQEQYRFVGGLRGDLPFISPSWTFEAAGVYSKSKGSSVRRGIREDKMAFALGIDPTADFDGDGVADNNGNGIADDYQIIPVGGVFGGPTIAPCDASALANPELAMPDLLAGCVPVNLFAPSVLGAPIGDFASAAERDYVFGIRSFDTTYEQLLFNAYATGDLFSIAPGGNVALVVGAEYREDKIRSLPDLVASDGLFFGFFSDLGAVGKRHVKEAFGELDIPLLLDQTAAKELRVNLSGRITDDQYYGTAETYSVKVGWRPFDQLLLKMSHGTSFRAPNLRENFLAGQSGFLTLFDPCAVPSDAFVNNMYNAATDNRDPAILANCAREGRDPTRVGIDPQNLNTIQTTSTEITTGGSLDLDPETSSSFTTGAAFEESFGGFRVALNANYYNIRIKGSITEPSSQFIINDCFTRQDGVRSQFCDRITASTDPSARFLISDIAAGFINLNQEKVKGMDFNADFRKDVPMFGRDVALGVNLRANHLIERSNIFIDDVGTPTLDDDTGEFGFPKWTGRATFTAEVGRVLFTWQTRYIGPVEQQEDGIDPLSDAFGNGPDGQPTGVIGDTCTGGGSANGNVPGDGVFCRDVGFAGKYFTHTVSLRYKADRWDARIGVTNLFDRHPPLVDGNEVFSISNTAIGNGYDLDGREFFFSANYRF